MAEDNPEIRPQQPNGEKPQVRIVSPRQEIPTPEHIFGNLKEDAPRVIIRDNAFLDAMNWLEGGGNRERAGVFVGNEIHDERTGSGDTESRVVGWVHSHPGFRPAPSDQDNHAMWSLGMSRAINYMAEDFFTMIVDYKNHIVGIFRRRGEAPVNEGGFVLAGALVETERFVRELQVTHFDRFSGQEGIAQVPSTPVSSGQEQGATSEAPIKITKEQIEAKRPVKISFSFWKRARMAARRAWEWIEEGLTH